MRTPCRWGHMCLRFLSLHERVVRSLEPDCGFVMRCVELPGTGFLPVLSRGRRAQFSKISAKLHPHFLTKCSAEFYCSTFYFGNCLCNSGQMQSLGAEGHGRNFNPKRPKQLSILTQVVDAEVSESQALNYALIHNASASFLESWVHC